MYIFYFGQLTGLGYILNDVLGCLPNYKTETETGSSVFSFSLGSSPLPLTINFPDLLIPIESALPSYH